MPRPRAAAALVIAAAASAACNADWRDFSASRQLHGETRLDARVDYAAGRLVVRPAGSGDLYRIVATYDASHFAPLNSYDPTASQLRVGLLPQGAGFSVGRGIGGRQEMTVELSDAVPLDLDVSAGAAMSRLELGGLRLRTFSFRTGASRSDISFARPNPARCNRATITAGAADVRTAALGNSGCETLSYDGGVGHATLDLTGAWPDSARVNVSLALGALTLRLPRSLGIRLDMDQFLASFPTTGWERDGAGFVSAGYAGATRHLFIHLSASIGGVDVEWVP